MENGLINGIHVCLGVLAFALGWALLLTALPYLGKGGKNLSSYFCQAPGLDVVLSLLIWVPWVVTGYAEGLVGVVGCVVGQVVALQLWILSHEILHARHRPEKRINAFLSQQFGWWRNQLALWVTAVVVPIFFLIRFAEVFVYPWLTWILGFKTYKHHEWINVSRHKFEGLIGTDLIWCLYCDWMTGVYALGAEMLRNVESFWCPIRFYYDKKCENCSVDFPDINAGWVAADGTMEEVVQTLDQQLVRGENWSWFADPDGAAAPAPTSSPDGKSELADL
jgi:hypothetical protein